MDLNSGGTNSIKIARNTASYNLQARIVMPVEGFAFERSKRRNFERDRELSAKEIRRVLIR